MAYHQPKTGLGSTAETNRLLGYQAFDPLTGASNTSPQKNQYVTSLNAARAAAVGAGRDPYAGNLGSLSTFTGSGPSSNNPPPTPEPDTWQSKYMESLSDWGKSQTVSPEEEADTLLSAELAGKYDTRSLEARRQYEATLKTPGMLKGGAEEAASLGRRRSESELADIAVQGSAADRRLLARQGVSTAKRSYLKTRVEMTKPFEVGGQTYDPYTGKLIPKAQANIPFELGPGQARYTYNPATDKYEETAKQPPLPKESKASDDETKRIESFNNDAAKAIEMLAQKTWKWETAWNIMRAKYPEASNQLIDQMLMKDKYENFYDQK